MSDNAPTPLLRWSVTPGDRATVVHVAGEIDLATQDGFAEAVRAGLDSSAPVVVLDLGEVVFMSSLGLRVVIEAHFEAHEAGRAVRIVDGASRVYRVLELSGLLPVLSTHRTLDEARATALESAE